MEMIAQDLIDLIRSEIGDDRAVEIQDVLHADGPMAPVTMAVDQLVEHHVRVPADLMQRFARVAEETGDTEDYADLYADQQAIVARQPV
ncbi:hypothetical protein NQ036_03675 [Brevibacterium sp. 91QC2O2]|uniref:hypothetical protein n=1 Tax=Brevibacterium TaxID=1696 RepID=UPI00211CF07C|nr:MULTISPECIES: hypothetical protein [unclassified Brevibacterium]MCQ9367346.1 hypothetical protein [Brevibacterium sp. 91QC2O2]MCQ9384641.1 hypothetical protein [Brevibacterium sp. 68QC2CO]